MANRRKYRNAIKLSGYTESWKVDILHDQKWSDAAIINLGVDTALGISLEKGKIKSEHLEQWDKDLESLQVVIAQKRERVQTVLTGQIKEEKHRNKTENDLRKIAKQLRRDNHIEMEDGKVVITERFLVRCEEVSEKLGIHVTPKMLADEIERQEASA